MAPTEGEGKNSVPAASKVTPRIDGNGLILLPVVATDRSYISRYCDHPKIEIGMHNFPPESTNR